MLLPLDARPAALPPATLDELAALTAAELLPLYQAASVPAEVSGDLVGRMLSFHGLRRGWLWRALRAFAAWRGFPWRGKSFSRGEGINRVFRAQRWFRFQTALGPSRADAGGAFQLDYDNPGNPFYIRAIKDEIRQVRPGLFLGQAYLVARGKTRLVLYFGLAQR
jgi:hypothetical protein